MSASPEFQFALFSFVSLFTMVNPVGVIPVYTSMTTSLTQGQSRNVAIRASFIAAIILAAFALTGQWIFRFFGISTDSLRIVGGVIFFLMGYEMLQARLTHTKYDDKPTHEYMNDIALTPLGIPVICGPGGIATVIILMNQAHSPIEAGIVLGNVLIIITITCLFMLGAKRVMQFIGENGNKVMLRLMGLIVMVIAVEFFFSGLRPILREILKIP